MSRQLFWALITMPIALNAYKFNNYLSRDIWAIVEHFSVLWSNLCMRRNCYILGDLAIRFSDPAFLIQSNNLAIR